MPEGRESKIWVKLSTGETVNFPIGMSVIDVEKECDRLEGEAIAKRS